MQKTTHAKCQGLNKLQQETEKKALYEEKVFPNVRIRLAMQKDSVLIASWFLSILRPLKAQAFVNRITVTLSPYAAKKKKVSTIHGMLE